MESELCRLHDLVDSDGRPQTKFLGRSQGVSVRQQHALPKRASASFGKVSIQAHALAWLSTRARELAHISRKVQRGYLLSDLAKRQWHSLTQKVVAEKGLPVVIRAIDDEWRRRLDRIRDHCLGRDTAFLESTAAHAHDAATENKRKHLEQRAESWRLFVSKQVANGAAAAHRIVKRDASPCVMAPTVGVGSERTASPQKVLECDLVEWRAI